jgi:hypothetical protein
METEPQREPLAEIPLSGGRLTPGIVRVGNTVRRPAKGNAAFVHDLLLARRKTRASLSLRAFSVGTSKAVTSSGISKARRGPAVAPGYPMIC